MKSLETMYYKVCQCGCGERFYGRRNQKYLNVDHKNFFNNGRRAARNEMISADLKSFKGNNRLLEKFFPLSKGIDWIPFPPLAKEGFDPDGLFHHEKEMKTGERIYRSGIYSFKLSADNKKIIIFKS
jgi:hypothetical protein